MLWSFFLISILINELTQVRGLTTKYELAKMYFQKDVIAKLPN